MKKLNGDKEVTKVDLTPKKEEMPFKKKRR